MPVRSGFQEDLPTQRPQPQPESSCRRQPTTSSTTFEDKDISIVAATYIFMAKEECDRIGDNFRDGTHANEMETAMMLALHPDLVKMDRIKDQVLPYEMRKVINFEQGACIVNKWPNSDGTAECTAIPPRPPQRRAQPTSMPWWTGFPSLPWHSGKAPTTRPTPTGSRKS